jgi:hypothetical protein
VLQQAGRAWSLIIVITTGTAVHGCNMDRHTKTVFRNRTTLTGQYCTSVQLYLDVHKILPEFSDMVCGRGSLVGIVTGYGLDGPGSYPGGGENFRTCPDRPRGPPNLLQNGYRVFPGGRKRPARDADPSPLLVTRSKTE